MANNETLRRKNDLNDKELNDLISKAAHPESRAMLSIMQKFNASIELLVDSIQDTGKIIETQEKRLASAIDNLSGQLREHEDRYNKKEELDNIRHAKFTTAYKIYSGIGLFLVTGACTFTGIVFSNYSGLVAEKTKIVLTVATIEKQIDAINVSLDKIRMDNELINQQFKINYVNDAVNIIRKKKVIRASK